MVIRVGDTIPEVKQEIADIVDYALGPGTSDGMGSWQGATDRINAAADFLERDGITDGMNGVTARARINALLSGPTWLPEGATTYLDWLGDRGWPHSSAWDLTRPTNATDDITGTLETYAPDVLRRADGYGALLEREGTNLLTWSSDLTNGVWSKSAVEIGSGNLLTIVTGSANAGVFQVATVTAGSTYTFAFDAMLGTMAEAEFRFAVYDVTNSGWVEKQIRPSITLTTSGYQRVTYSFVAPSGCSSVRVYPYRNDAAISGTVYLRRNQLETGPVATSYIPTEGATASRAADLLTVPAQDGGRAFVFDFDLLEPPAIAGNARWPLRWGDAGATEIRVQASSSGALALITNVPGTTQRVAAINAWQGGKSVIYGVATASGLRFGVTSLGETNVVSVSDFPSGLDTLSIAGNGYSDLRNTNIRARRFMEILNPPDPVAAFAQVRAIAEGWAE